VYDREVAARERFRNVQAALVRSGVTNSSLLEQTDTNQYYALTWLSQTDPLEIRPDDPALISRYALAVFFYSNHPTTIAKEHSQTGVMPNNLEWKSQDGWMTRSSICRWYGVECGTSLNNEEGVLVWNMTNNQLRGTLPLEIGALSLLEVLDLVRAEN